VNRRRLHFHESTGAWKAIWSARQIPLGSMLSTLAAAIVGALALNSLDFVGPRSHSAIRAVIAPSTIFVGERVSVRAAAYVAEDGVLHRLSVCGPDGYIPTDCETTEAKTIRNKGEWRGEAGVFSAIQPGEYVITWTLYADWGADAGRATARQSTVIRAEHAPQ
jgi:hypothetical protein